MKNYCIIIDNETGKAARSKTKTAIYANTTITAKEFDYMQKTKNNIESVRNYTIHFDVEDWKCDITGNIKLNLK